MPEVSAERIDALLPQTQCEQCGFAGCRPYADAIAAGAVDINRCAPGGAAGVGALAALLDRSDKPLDPAHGNEQPPTVALIDEDVCIGCTKCIQACPVDAIVGAAKRMHSVIAAECTGCGLCLPPCPVDCISLPAIADRPLARAAVMARAARARARFEARNRRLARVREKIAAGRATVSTATTAPAAAPITRSAVLAAIARGRARRSTGGDST